MRHLAAGCLSVIRMFLQLEFHRPVGWVLMLGQRRSRKESTAKMKAAESDKLFSGGCCNA
jgi:hypothetical protein